MYIKVQVTLPRWPQCPFIQKKTSKIFISRTRRLISIKLGILSLITLVLQCIYTEQKKKRNNYIPLNFEKTIIQSKIIAFSTYA